MEDKKKLIKGLEKVRVAIEESYDDDEDEERVGPWIKTLEDTIAYLKLL